MSPISDFYYYKGVFLSSVTPDVLIKRDRNSAMQKQHAQQVGISIRIWKLFFGYGFVCFMVLYFFVKCPSRKLYFVLFIAIFYLFYYVHLFNCVLSCYINQTFGQDSDTCFQTALSSYTDFVLTFLMSFVENKPLESLLQYCTVYAMVCTSTYPQKILTILLFLWLLCFTAVAHRIQARQFESNYTMAGNN